MKTQNIKNKKALMLVLLVSTLMSACATQNSQQSRRQGGGHKGMAPPEATEACANLSENAACGFSGREGESIEGTCVALPESDALACAPEDGAMPMPRR